MIPCPLCGGVRFRPFLERPPLVLLRCRACGLVHLDREPGVTNQEKFERVYAERHEVNALTVERYAELLRSLAPYRLRNRLLEIGCGAGAFLRQARAAGWSVTGTENAWSTIERLRAQGLEVWHGTTEFPGEFDEHFDAAVMLEVIEHLSDFRALLDEAWRVVRPGGRLILSTPNIGSLTRRLIGGRWRIVAEEHLWYFSPTTLRRALRGAGFTMTSIESRNFYPPEVWLAWTRVDGTRGLPVVGDQPSSRLRHFTARTGVGRLLKIFVNRCLRATGAGDTIWAFAERTVMRPRNQEARAPHA